MILQRLKELCLKKNTSIPQLEKVLDFGDGTIYKWGSSSPSVANLKKVADYLGVDINYFLEQEPSKQK